MIKKGCDTLYNGRLVVAKNFLKKPIPGKKIYISGDTRPVDVEGLYKNCGIVIHECTYLGDTRQDIDNALTRKHTTYLELEKLKNKHRIPLVVCTHFSAKFNKKPASKTGMIIGFDGLEIQYG